MKTPTMLRCGIMIGTMPGTAQFVPAAAVTRNAATDVVSAGATSAVIVGVIAPVSRIVVVATNAVAMDGVSVTPASAVIVLVIALVTVEVRLECAAADSADLAAVDGARRQGAGKLLL